MSQPTPPRNRPLTFLITGCSSGLGLTLSRIVLAHGHALIATSRNPSRTPELVAEIESARPAGRGRWLALDVDSPTAGPDLINKLEREEGVQVDVLVNNAGYSIHAPVETLTDGELRRLMETIYFGPARLIRAVVPYMRERRFGVVVSMSTGAGLEGRESMGGYAAAKAAIDGLMKVLATEIEPFGVRTLTVQLGAFNTTMATAARVGEAPLPADYKGSVAEQITNMLISGNLNPEGDQEKAMKAVYEVVVGEGVGTGRERERMLPLGRDLAKRVSLVQNRLSHAMEVFGDVCNNVYLDGK